MMESKSIKKIAVFQLISRIIMTKLVCVCVCVCNAHENLLETSF